jgi:hypothetical protein
VYSYGRGWIHDETAEELHAHDGVDEEEHAHQHAHVGQGLHNNNTVDTTVQRWVAQHVSLDVLSALGDQFLVFLNQN